MASANTISTVSIRLPADLHARSVQLAQREHKSLNALVVESLAATLEKDEDQAWFDSFTLLGEDPELTDVEYAAPAQAEVMLNERSSE